MKKVIIAFSVFTALACGRAEDHKYTCAVKGMNCAEEQDNRTPATTPVPGPQGSVGEKGDVGETGAAGSSGTTTVVTVVEPVPAPVLTPEQALVDNLVADYNNNRTFAGQGVISPGLSCSVVKFGTVATPQFPNSIAQATGGAGWTVYNVLNYTYTGTFNQPVAATSTGFNIFPAALQQNPTFQTWYLVTCSGYLVVTHTDYYNFSLTSDDGSILNVAGLTVNNDGNHSTATVQGETTLNDGVQSFKIRYMQAGGQESLILTVNGNSVNSMYFYH